MSRRLSILGSTGSIGVNTLNVVDRLPGLFDVVCLTAGKNAELLIEQSLKYNPETVVINDQAAFAAVRSELAGKGISVLQGSDALVEVAAQDVDLVLNALVGSAGMAPTIAAVKSGTDVALSNKESLVMAGGIINRLRRRTGSSIYPIDSEHSAIWQCLAGEDNADIKRLILTGSGGPFRTRDKTSFKNITVTEALNHPNWSMGSKITIDSATMMNKGLEVIEAFWLFDIGPDRIDVIIHPQSIIHSLVEFNDGSQKAQLGLPDMKIPIQYALTYPRHFQADWESLDLVKQKQLTFEEPDHDKFPCIGLAYDVLEKGGTAPAVLNVANEQAVYRFLREEIKFTQIPVLIENALAKHHWVEKPDLLDIKEIEHWTETFINSSTIS